MSGWLAGWLARWLTGSPVRWLDGLLAVWFAGSLPPGSLPCWLVGCLAAPLVTTSADMRCGLLVIQHVCSHMARPFARQLANWSDNSLAGLAGCMLVRVLAREVAKWRSTTHAGRPPTALLP